MGAVCRRTGCLSPPRAARDAVRYRLFRAGVRGLDRVLAPSHHVAAELAGVGVDCEHVPLPVAAPPQPPARRPAPDPSFVYAGRLAPVKGVELLLRAFARVRDEHPRATLWVCGDGRERERIVARVAALGLGDAVAFRPGMEGGWVEHLEEAWALVAPSLYREPLGLVAIEAIARDVPVVASAEGGFAESVAEGRSGLLFPNGDEDALAACMLRVCDGAFPDHRPDPAARAELARRHDLGDHVRVMERIWREAGAPARATGPR
jgi:glycosyltransferase involved in cell wall biosynthesis